MGPNDVKCVYVLHGSDEYLRDEHRRAIIAQAIGDADPQVCVSAFDATTELPEVLDTLRTLPFLAPRRVVTLSQADAFITAHREGLEGYLENPAPSGTLVLMVDSWPSNTRLYKAVRKIGQVFDCAVPKQENLAAWVGRAAQRRGRKIAPEAAELLAQWIGADLAVLDAEVEKLSLYAGDRTTIEERDVAALVTDAAGPGAFDLTNRIAEADAPAALKALDGMIARRGEEFRALGMIAWHLRRALGTAQALAAGAPVNRALPRMPPEQQNAFLGMVRRRGLRKIQDDFRRMIRADLGMKSGADARAAMQELVIALCS